MELSQDRRLGPKPLSYNNFSEHKNIDLNDIFVGQRAIDIPMFIVKDERLSKWRLMIYYGFMSNNGPFINDTTFNEFASISYSNIQDLIAMFQFCEVFSKFD